MAILEKIAESPLRPLLLLAVVLFAVWQIKTKFFPKYQAPLPPSPPGEPILGHFRIIPLENPHLKHMEWAKELNSDVVYFNNLGNHVVVLNSIKAANDLLDKRGAIYCDRPEFVLFDVMGWGLTLTFMRWGPRFKMHRSILQSGFTKTNITAYRFIQEEEARQAAFGIINKPDDWVTVTRRFASAIVLRIGFGVTISTDDDPYIQIARDANFATGGGGNPGTALVDQFPALKYLPNWLVRSKTLKHARDWRWAIRRLHDVPFASVRKDFNDGTAKPSFAYNLLTKYSENEKQGIENEFTIRDINGASASVFIAGSNTTWATTTICVLNMMRNPDIFLKARAEIDRVVGTDRLPALSDRPNLRYIDYIVEEASRWRPLSPIGIPHKSIADDIYEGMFIPKGTNVYYNAYAFSRDPRVYKDAERYNPDRYIPVSEGGDGEPFLTAPFGFGRRICVGRHLAQASVWIIMATLISTVEISHPIGPDGKPFEPKIQFSTGLSSHPGEFPVGFKPRSEKATALLAAAIKR